MDEELKKISNRIKEMRRLHNVTQKQLAEALDISVTNMCNIENGKTAVTIQNLIKMKNFFSCEMQDFFIDELALKKKSEPVEPEQKIEAKEAEPRLPEAIELQDAINLLRLLRRVDIKGI